ncbi:MAG: DUF2760 domain-containing protein [Propionivibrio sp.]
MEPTHPSFLRRIALACGSFFAIIARPELAAVVARLRAGGEPPQPAGEVDKPAVPTLRAAPHEAALQLLGLLQRDARLVDFVEEDIAPHADADIGAAARIVHEGCRKVLREHFSIEPLRAEAEGSRITLAAGFDAAAIRLTGNVVGQPPFTGNLSHRGWKVVDSRLPQIVEGHDPAIVAQAEVEL